MGQINIFLINIRIKFIKTIIKLIYQLISLWHINLTNKYQNILIKMIYFTM